MTIPPVIPRRPLDDEHPDGYKESDKDFVLNNYEACLWFLENRDKLAAMENALEFYADPAKWADIETGIGMFPGDAIDYGATAREALAYQPTKESV